MDKKHGKTVSSENNQYLTSSLNECDHSTRTLKLQENQRHCAKLSLKGNKGPRGMHHNRFKAITTASTAFGVRQTMICLLEAVWRQDL